MRARLLKHSLEHSLEHAPHSSEDPELDYLNSAYQDPNDLNSPTDQSPLSPDKVELIKETLEEFHEACLDELRRLTRARCDLDSHGELIQEQLELLSGLLVEQRGRVKGLSVERRRRHLIRTGLGHTFTLGKRPRWGAPSSEDVEVDEEEQLVLRQRQERGSVGRVTSDNGGS
ncbi:hypothetical protein BC938DRAFT_475348 [Jimgerdemannia flammicorona]|uniref:Uncharacterized protein n=1 Tax=Jimgerdemannia flammicorona TaxID=994334 RepID=A0A433QRM9_9FUNG|nr:hypothetical protein BC938DRAFT_475348 [Jimgerdemannia flammicorona]